MEDLAQQVMKAENESRKSAKSLFLSEAFVFVVCSARWTPFTQNTKPHDIYTVCNVYPEYKRWMSKGIVL